MLGSGVVGNYEILRRLNIGGMGEIFPARQRSLGGISRLAIVKTLRPELSAQPDMVEQFFDEARIIASLNHPNIVVIYDVAEDRGTPYIAMEFIDGVDVSLLITLSEQQGALISPRLAESPASPSTANDHFLETKNDDITRCHGGNGGCRAS